MLLIAVIFLTLSIALIFFPQSFWNLVNKNLTGLFGSIFFSGHKDNIWSSVIKNRKRRRSTGLFIFLLGILFFLLAVGAS